MKLNHIQFFCKASTKLKREVHVYTTETPILFLSSAVIINLWNHSKYHNPLQKFGQNLIDG